MWRRIAAGVALAAGGAGAVLAIDNSDGAPTAHGAARATAHTATVRRRNLVDRQRVDGTLGYSGGRQVAMTKAKSKRSRRAPSRNYQQAQVRGPCHDEPRKKASLRAFPRKCGKRQAPAEGGPVLAMRRKPPLTLPMALC